MATPPRRAITVYATRAAIAQDPGPFVPQYAFELETGHVYRWVPEDATTANGRTVLTHSGGNPGRWHLVRSKGRGAALADSDATVVVADGFTRRIAVSAGRTLTLSPTGAAEGDPWTLTRTDTTAFTIAIVNGGPLGGTIHTLPVSTRYFVDAEFDGVDWGVVRAGSFGA